MDGSASPPPVPDPSALATEAIERAVTIGRREVAALRELLETRIVISDTRLDDLKALLDERHASQLRAFETARSTALESVQAAMTATREAVAKAETATEKRFDCVASNVRILCSDLIWRPAGELLPGDELITCDETAPTRRGRRFRRAVVTANNLAQDDLLLVTTPMGQIRCNAHHPWLARRDSTIKYARGNWNWVRTEDLRPGDSVLHALDPWEVDLSWESGWLAGMYDGEGCLTLDRNSRSQLSLTQRESATSDEIERVLKTHVSAMCVHRSEPGTSRRKQPLYHYIVTKLPDVLRILGTVRPLRLLAKADGAWESKPIASWHRAVPVISVEHDGTGTIAQLSTSTHTYIADGFIMHNSVNEFRKALSDQTVTFLPRTEYDTAHDSLVQRVGIINDRIAAIELRLTSRLDIVTGQDAGAAEAVSERRLSQNTVVSILAALIIGIGVIISVLTYAHR